MERAMISLSFDDGRRDNLKIVKEILVPMCIPATLNITTGYVDGTCPKELLPCDKPAMTVQEIVELSRVPTVELALHGDFHQNTESDIAAGREKMLRWLDLPDDMSFGFASPGSGMALSYFADSENDLFTKEIAYLRTDLRVKRFRWIKTLCRKAGRVVHVPMLYRIAYSDTLMSECPDKIIYSVPVIKDTTVGQLKSLIDLSIEKRSALTLMFHSVQDDVSNEDNWTWERGKFEQICDYLNQQRRLRNLEISTTRELFESVKNAE